MTNQFRASTGILFLLAWGLSLAGCSGDAEDFGGGPGGRISSIIDTVFAVQDTVYHAENPLVASSELWVGNHAPYSVHAEFMLQFYDFPTIFPWYDDDGITLDTCFIVLQKAGSLGVGGSADSTNVFAYDLQVMRVDSLFAAPESLKWTDLYDDFGPRYSGLDSLTVAAQSDQQTLSIPLSRSWIFNAADSIRTDTLNVLFKPASQEQLDYLIGFWSVNAEDASEPRLKLVYNTPTGTDTLAWKPKFDTHVYHDTAQPDSVLLPLSHGDSWRFALSFADLDHYFTDGTMQAELHSRTRETINAAYIRLYPALSPESYPLFGSDDPIVEVRDLLVWDGSSFLPDTSGYQTTFTAAAAVDDYLEINITQLVNLWLDRSDYRGVEFRLSNRSGPLSPVRRAYQSTIAETGRPVLVIYRSQASF